MSFTRSWTSTAQKIFSGLREKRFEHDDSTGLCQSNTLTAMKGWIVFWFQCQNFYSWILLLDDFNGRRFWVKISSGFHYFLVHLLSIFGGAGISAVIIHQILTLARDWSKRVTWANIPLLKLGNIRGYSPIL